MVIRISPVDRKPTNQLPANDPRGVEQQYAERPLRSRGCPRRTVFAIDVPNRCLDRSQTLFATQGKSILRSDSNPGRHFGNTLLLSETYSHSLRGPISSGHHRTWSHSHIFCTQLVLPIGWPCSDCLANPKAVLSSHRQRRPRRPVRKCTTSKTLDELMAWSSLPFPCHPVSTCRVALANRRGSADFWGRWQMQ